MGRPAKNKSKTWELETVLNTGVTPNITHSSDRRKYSSGCARLHVAIAFLPSRVVVCVLLCASFVFLFWLWVTVLFFWAGAVY